MRTKDEVIAKLESGEKMLSYSAIKAFMQSPKHLIEYYLKVFDPTPAMELGTVLDWMMTEPERIANDVLVVPTAASYASHDGLTTYAEFFAVDCPRSLKVAERKEIIRAEAAKRTANGAIFLSAQDFETCEFVVDRVMNNRAARFAFELCDLRQDKFTTEIYGWTFRGARDMRCPGILTVDLKKTADASPFKFRRQARSMQYALQGAIYTHETNEDYYLLAYDMNANVCVHKVHESTINRALDTLGRTVKQLERCIEEGAWEQSYEFFAPDPVGHYLF